VKLESTERQENVLSRSENCLGSLVYVGSPGKSGDGGKGRISIAVIEDWGSRIEDWLFRDL
jgi:hypothetical protein